MRMPPFLESCGEGVAQAFLPAKRGGMSALHVAKLFALRCEWRPRNSFVALYLTQIEPNGGALPTRTTQQNRISAVGNIHEL